MRWPSPASHARADFPAAEEPPQDLSFEIHRTIASLETEWRTLDALVEQPLLFQSYDWCMSWVCACHAAGVNEDVRIVVGRRGGLVCLLWPLAVRRLFGCRVLHSLAEPATQCSDVLVAPTEHGADLVRQALAFVTALPDTHIVELRRVRDGSHLAGAPMLSGYAVENTETTAPALDFTRLGTAAVDSHRSSRSRNALRRHARQLGAFGPVRYELVQTPEQQRAALSSALALKHGWLRTKGMISTGYAHPANAGCLLALADQGKLLGAKLLVGDQVAAVEIGAVQRGCYWSLVQSYDFAFARHAPGRLLFQHLLEHCPALGISMFDFLAPAAPHKCEWSNVEVPVRDFLMPTSILGTAAHTYLTDIKPRLRAFVRHLPQPVRQTAGRFAHVLS